ncbi:17737_t:CDS:2 [Funneliformis geosporum]|nr:17737_t:CDS:2 [Funneliformis geosporum]
MAQDTISFQVNFKGRIIKLESWSLDNTIHELKEFLANNIGIPSEFQKLIYKDTKTLRECNLKSGIKIMLMGSSPEDIQSIKLSDSKVIHQPSNKSKSKFAINPYKDIKRVNELTSSELNYTFHNIQVIEQFPEPGKARALLEKLRDDKGIRAIMKKYKWNVGNLREISPSEKDVLGYNKNGGELITLRLRTNDMEGFRHYPEIRRVLLHELVHNVWSDHDDNFHRLNRQLNKEVGKFFFNILVELDWTASSGHKISNAEFYNAPEEEAIDEKSWQGGTFVLGGVGSDRRLPKRELLAEATLLRLTKEEKELDDSCGSK